MNQWQPIETAPKDTSKAAPTRVVLLTDGEDIYLGFWNGRSWDDGDFRDNLGEMTHWMPLPELPS